MIALITPTGGRQKQIDLCYRWMKHQTYEGDVLWVIVDDCVPVTTNNIDVLFKKNWDVRKVFPKPEWEKGQNTQTRNILAGIDVVKQFKPYYTFIIEDDDYYTPQYLTEMVKKCDGSQVVGERFTVYYNVATKGWRRNGNKSHSSLFQTAFSKEGLQILENVCKKNAKFVDLILFRNFISKSKIKLFDGLDLAIGIKGLPGRPGIGIGHRSTFSVVKDKDYSMLKKWLGEDYIYYL